MGATRVREGNSVGARITRMEKTIIDLNAYRQRQEEALEAARREAEEMRNLHGAYGSPELQAVIEALREELDSKASKEDTVAIAHTVELNVEQVDGVKQEQTEIREELRLAAEATAAAAIAQAQAALATACAVALDEARCLASNGTETGDVAGNATMAGGTNSSSS